MTLWHRVKSHMFGRSSGTSPSEIQLPARDKPELSKSVEKLELGKRGWISKKKAGALFSTMGDEFAFGELDTNGTTAIKAFAAHSRHRSEFTFAPNENRVYFTRLASQEEGSVEPVAT